ncbi:hypothetical protein FC18_GL000486 [Lacticaseibacillus sharpeae JCM 1186 = DSM 20505]|uniref:Uncharacterized protein n=2 Tax=Lacticaseibacillus sharpeae TaxID=1626 RepID=A0A0R1ZQQ8_9LACO|nr:hypothetical protein FC18_GL000486 [Lacticaseibacillus sharpeae JCM 1186 = DSM 20505]
MVTYVDGLTNVILRTDVIMGSETAARRRLNQSLTELWREGDTYKLIVDRGLNGVGYRIVRLH